MSVPGLMAPVERDGRKLVDGGLVDNVPIGEARERCQADVVIAVNVGSPLLKPDEIGSLLSVTAQMVNILTEQNVTQSLATLKPTDIYIKPDLDGISAGDFERNGETADRGAQRRRGGWPSSCRRLSVSEAQYASWRRRIDAPERAAARVDEIEIAGLQARQSGRRGRGTSAEDRRTAGHADPQRRPAAGLWRRLLRKRRLQPAARARPQHPARHAGREVLGAGLPAPRARARDQLRHRARPTRCARRTRRPGSIRSAARCSQWPRSATERRLGRRLLPAARSDAALLHRDRRSATNGRTSTCSRTTSKLAELEVYEVSAELPSVLASAPRPGQARLAGGPQERQHRHRPAACSGLRA